MDYNNLTQVIELAKKLGSSLVTKHPDRHNYNITPISRTDLYKPEWVVWKP